MVAHVLVGVTVAVHFAVLGYVLAGGFLAWRWRWALYLHVPLVVWAVLIIAVPWLDCPLTLAENAFRGWAGMPAVHGFIDHYVTGVLYPERYLLVVQLLVGLSVLVSWVGLLARRRGSRRAGADRVECG
jgi:hypothetical protein